MKAAVALQHVCILINRPVKEMNMTLTSACSDELLLRGSGGLIDFLSHVSELHAAINAEDQLNM